MCFSTQFQTPLGLYWNDSMMFLTFKNGVIIFWGQTSSNRKLKKSRTDVFKLICFDWLYRYFNQNKKRNILFWYKPSFTNFQSYLKFLCNASIKASELDMFSLTWIGSKQSAYINNSGDYIENRWKGDYYSLLHLFHRIFLIA